MAGSSAPVDKKAGKYIITSRLSLPKGFTVNYSIQGKQAGGKRVGEEKGGREGNKKQYVYIFNLFKRLTKMAMLLIEEFNLNAKYNTAFI